MTAKELLTNAGLAKTYWGKKIIAAEKRGELDETDYSMSLSWQTCACGKQDARIPRDKYGCPEDYQLYRLGEDFPRFIRLKEFLDAAQTLVAIEKRAAEILKEVCNDR